MIVSDLRERLRLQDFSVYVGSDLGPDPRFLRLTGMARRLFDLPIAMVNLIDAADMWPKAEEGICVGRQPRETTLCNLVIDGGTLVVPDLAADPRFTGLPGVVQGGLRFYAGAPILTPSGQVLGVLCVLDRQPRPDFRTDQAATLEELAGIAMDQLSLDKVRRDAAAAQKAAEQMAQARASFLAMMSHEIRTPLNAILGFGEMLARADLPEPYGDYARTVHDTGRSLMQVLNHTLDYARLESGKVELEERPFSLSDLVARGQRLVQKTCHDKGLTLSVDLDPALPVRLRGDGIRLQQVLNNLLFNAAKFTDTGGIVLSLRHDGRDGHRFRLRIDVVDSGIGIDPNRRDNLFTPFFQADSSHARRFDGSGLGLAICRQLVHAMGGEIGYEPVPQGGSRFWLRLPLVAA